MSTSTSKIWAALGASVVVAAAGVAWFRHHNRAKHDVEDRIQDAKAAESKDDDAICNANNIARAKELWKTCDCVAFDVDSTVLRTEGIDELAGHCGVGQQVKELTSNAMNGGMLFQDAIKLRLDLIKPSQLDFQLCHEQRPPRFTDGVRQVIQALHARGCHVFLISGGFRQMIDPIAEELNIPKDHIFANNILFHEDGSYRGFDPNEPTSRTGGKAKAVQTIRQKYNFKSIVMIGDGITDLEAKQPGAADAFVGFGGIVVRPLVQQQADWFVHSFKEILDLDQ